MANSNKRQAEHLNALIDEQGITKTYLAEVAGVSPQSVSGWFSGTPMRAHPAECIHAKWPEYSVEWIRGFVEHRNDGDLAYKMWLEDKNNYLRREKAVLMLAKFHGGYEITAPFADDREGDPWEKFESENLAFSRSGKTVVLTASQCAAFTDEVSGYVTMRIDQMLERGEW